VDPAGVLPAAVNFPGLMVQQAPASPGGGPAPAVSSRALQLYDTRCDASTRAAPTTHASHDSARAGAVCSGAGRPDLMGPAAVPGASSDPLHDFSDEVTRPANGGLVLMRDDRAGTCTDPAGLGYAPADAPERKRSIHTWSTPPSTAPFETPVTGGRGSVTRWTGTAAAQEAPGRLCVVVQRAATGEVLGSADFRLPSWPAEPARLTVAFDLARQTFAAGERVLLTLRCPQDSGGDLQLLYDHPAYAANLTLSSPAGKEFR
jgi:hypothetical protein